MAAATDFLEDALLDHILNNTAYASPANVFLALFTTATADDGSGTEVTGGSYARVSVVGNFTLTGGGSGQATNTAQIQFPQATAGWGTVTHFAIFDASTGGNMLIHGALTGSIAVASGETVQFDPGDLDVSVA